MVTGYNPDIDPTRLQPYGNPHARVVGPGMDESPATQELRAEVAEEMSGEGDSAEELKGKRGRGARGGRAKAPDGFKRLADHPNEFVNSSGKIVNESGAHIATLATPAADEVGMPVRIVKDDSERKAPEGVKVPGSTPPGGTPLETVAAGNPDAIHDAQDKAEETADPTKLESADPFMPPPEGDVRDAPEPS